MHTIIKQEESKEAIDAVDTEERGANKRSAEETILTAVTLIQSLVIAFQQHTTIKQEEDEDTEECLAEERLAEERRVEERRAEERRLWLTG